MGNGVRSKGSRITQSQRLRFAQRLRALLHDDPTLSIEKLVQRTGAPYDMTNVVKRKFREERERAS